MEVKIILKSAENDSYVLTKHLFAELHEMQSKVMVGEKPEEVSKFWNNWN